MCMCLLSKPTRTVMQFVVYVRMYVIIIVLCCVVGTSRYNDRPVQASGAAACRGEDCVWFVGITDQSCQHEGDESYGFYARMQSDFQRGK